LSGTGQVYYTLDGTDPRQQGGGVHPAAVLYTGPIRLTGDAVVTVRALNGDEWSPRDQATFAVDQVPADASNFRLSEIHYHPALSDETEFLEWTNPGSQTVNVQDVVVSGGVRFAFRNSATTKVEPGGRVLLVRNQEAFILAYPGTEQFIAGTFEGSLSNGGDTITVRGQANALIQELTYDDDVSLGWPALPDGGGPSLQAIGAGLECGPARCDWRPSAINGGTPGQAEFPIGDSTLDRVFNSSDLVLVFQAGKYENAIVGDANWADGDWNGDGDFTTSDLVLAFQQGNYLAAAHELSVDRVFAILATAVRPRPAVRT
jgi:hypothetical protein